MSEDRCHCELYRVGHCPCMLAKEERIFICTGIALVIFIAVSIVALTVCTSGKPTARDRYIDCFESGGHWNRHYLYCK